MNIKKNKIVCTIGLASDSSKTITKTVGVGMDIARVSFSHDTHQEKAEVIQNIKRTEKIQISEFRFYKTYQGPEFELATLMTR